MPVFTYEVEAASKQQHGTVVAGSLGEARALLRERGLRVRSLEPEVEVRRRWSWGQFWRRGEDVSGVARDLGMLLGVGVSLSEALEAVIRSRSGRMRESLLGLKEQVSQGTALADAMAGQPAIWSPLAVQMVRVGEGAGSLDEVLRQLAEFQERSSQLRDRVLSAVTYPAFVFVAAILVSVFLMTVIVPTLLNGLTEAGRELPWPTLVLQWGSNVLTQYGWLIAIAAVCGAVGLAWSLASERGRERWQRLVLRAPLLGEMTRKQAISKASMMISYLLKSGVEFVPAVELTAGSLSHIPLRKAFQEGLTSVRAGRSIVDALGRSGMFPEVALQVFGVGQEAGQLDEMLERLAEDYDRQVTTLSNRLATAVEPVLILGLSVFVGFILFATILPILEAGRIL